MFMLNNKPLALDTPFTVGEGDGAIQYPANWLRLASADEKTAIGITEVADPEGYDDRFYWGVGNPKDLVQLKAQWTAWVDDTAWLLLQKTDYMDFRHASDNTYTPPADWVTWRNAVRAQAKAAKAAIAAATDVPSLQTAIAVQWTPDPTAAAALAAQHPTATAAAPTTATATPAPAAPSTPAA